MKNEHSERCIVAGCENRQGEGRFIGVLCAPCHAMITEGRVGPTKSFLRQIPAARAEVTQLTLRVLALEAIQHRAEVTQLTLRVLALESLCREAGEELAHEHLVYNSYTHEMGHCMDDKCLCYRLAAAGRGEGGE